MEHPLGSVSSTADEISSPCPKTEANVSDRDGGHFALLIPYLESFCRFSWTFRKFSAISVHYLLFFFWIKADKVAVDNLEEVDYVSKGIGRLTLGVVWAYCGCPGDETEQDNG